MVFNMARRVINISPFNHIKLTSESVQIQDSDVVSRCIALKTKYEQERHSLEETWKDSWATYLTTPEARQHASARVLDIIGNIDNNWRHNLVTAKAFETVETIVSYLQSSFFPNPRWFDLEPRSVIPYPEWEEIVDVNRRFVDNKLQQQKFSSIYRQYLRELCITGTAGIAMPWRSETKERFSNSIEYSSDGRVLVIPKKTFEKSKNAPDLKIMSVFDFYLDPEVDDPNESNVIRKFKITKGDLILLVESGKYPMANLEDIKLGTHIAEELRTANQELELMLGISSLQSPDGTSGNVLVNNHSFGSDLTEIFEFWGDIIIKNVEFKDVHIVWSGRHLLQFSKNPYWSGKPFQFGTYVGVSGTPYGIGCLQPVLPNLYQQNVLMSRRADNISVGSDMMMTVLADGVTDIEEVYVAPGHKIPVTTHDAVRPLDLNTDQNVSLSEEGVLEQRIDKATGTGPFIGVGAGRSAERVTAEEIQAQRDAGGNRLNGVYSHIEETSMIPFLEKYHELCRQFILEPEVIRVPRGNNLFAHILVGPELLQFPMHVRALGAGHIADKEFRLKQLLDWINIVSSIESMASEVNWSQIPALLAERMVPDVKDRLIISEEERIARNQDQANLLAQQQQQLSSADPQQEINDAAQFIGGQPAVAAAQEALLSGTGEGDIQNIAEALGFGGPS